MDALDSKKASNSLTESSLLFYFSICSREETDKPRK